MSNILFKIDEINNVIFDTMIKDKTIAKCTVIKRGWTKKMFEQFFSIPTYRVPNPHFATAPMMKLYRISEVLRIEQTAEFIDYWNKIAHKREVARALMIKRHGQAKAKLIEMKQHTIGMSNQCA